MPSEKRIEAFLAVLRDGSPVGEAARAAGISRKTAYQWRRQDPEFAAAWDDAVEDGTDTLESVAIRRAVDHSDTLLIFMLKSRRPEIYRERASIEHSGPGGGPIQSQDVTARELITREILSIAARVRDTQDPVDSDGGQG